MNGEVDNMTDKQLRYINRLTVFVRKLLKLVLPAGHRAPICLCRYRNG